MIPARSFLVLAILTLILFGQVGDMPAQIKVEVDEQVKVPAFDGWVDGVVVEIKKREILVEYQFAAGSRSDVFTRKQIRKLYEYEGQDFGRIWKSASGSFKIEAALHSVTGDDVALIKPDLAVISLAMDKLSKEDVAYVERFKKKVEAEVKRGIRPAMIPVLPEIESFGQGFELAGAFGAARNSKLKLKPTPSYLKSFKQAGMGFSLIRREQKLVAVVPVGGPDQMVLMSFRERNPFKEAGRTNFQSQVYWASLKKKKVVNYVSIAHEDFAIDYNPRYKLLLTFNRSDGFMGEFDDPDHYTIWKMEVGAATAKPLVRFAAKGVDWGDSLFGKIVNERIVVVKTGRSTYEAFDIKEKKAVYRLNAASLLDAPVDITHDRKHLIVPEDGFVSIVNSATGKFEFSEPVNERYVSGASVNDAGTKLAAVTERNIYVWDLTSENAKPKVYPAPLMGSPFRSRIEWIDDDHILGESHRSRILYRLSARLAIWSYEMDISQYFLNRDPLSNMVVDGKFFYAAQPNPFGGSIALGAVELPGPSVDEVTANIDRDSLMIVKPGVGISLDIGNVSEPGKVRQWLIDKFDQNGWVFDPDAELSVVAEMGRKKSEGVTYQEWGTGKGTNVSFTAHFASLKIMKGDLIVWQTGTRTAPPSFVRLGEGQTVQGEVDRFSKPRVEFYKDVQIESEIIDPLYSRGFGKSILGLRGIQVESVTPPGRENDPLAASRKADEDRRKSVEEEGKAGGAGPSGGR